MKATGAILAALLLAPAPAHAHKNTHRNFAARAQFMKQTGHPHGWKGHEIDHVIPLKCGGPDTPDNMQWQTTEEAKAKDQQEKNCTQPPPHKNEQPTQAPKNAQPQLRLS